MKKAPGIVIVSALLALLSFRLFGAHPSVTSNATRIWMRGGYLALGVLSLVVARALWRGTSRAFALFVAWSLLYLAVGGAVQCVAQRTPSSEVAIWWVFMGAVLAAVGAHLRYALRQAL